ncbi:protein kinase domain-containing protein [Gimesia sp.]|uniref:serine/threonine protein kinase n=1 Tax=Gimesia sp. TaxID=2024833 RepID=UPI003A8FE4F1
MNQPFELENLPAELQSQIEERCEDFEQSWQNGENPSLEKTLFDFTNPSRSILLKELILIERYYRLRETGKIISEQELLEAHPEIAGELSKLFSDSHSARTRIADQSDSGSADSSGGLTVQESRLHFEQFPARFGRYQILSRLGEGGMGCVYLARDTQLERKVALKLPQINSHADTQFITRFYREARAAANLNHPNLCSVYDVDQIDDVHYITMEFIEGESLAALIQAGQKFSQTEIAQLIQQLAQALELAHQQGIVHRDLKPANIMIRQDGTPIITDFGLATMSQNEEATQLTQHGQIMGSPSYMSPEQVEGDLEKIGPASDVYSLGVIMYELLAGQRPFQGTTASILSQIMTKDPRPVRNIQPDIDSRLDQICRKMMARSTELRYHSMQEVSQVLAAWQETTLPGTSGKRLSPGRILVGMGLAAVLLLGISFLRPSSSQGTLHVTLNDQRAQILLDGKPLDLTSGSWTGTQKSGSHELSLQIGDQRLPWGELTTVKSEGNEQRVLASVNGVPLKNGRFEIVADSKESAEIKLNWLPSPTPGKSAKATSPVADQPGSPVPQVADPAEPFAREREVTEWLIKRGGIVRFNMAHDFKFNIKDIKELPDEPFRLKEIYFDRSRNKPLTDLSSLSQLMTLEELNLNQAKVSSAALKGLVLKQAFETLHILQAELKVSDLKEIQGLEFVDTLELGGSQIDDHFAFLEQMPNLRALEIVDILPAKLKELSESPLLRQSKLRFLRLRPNGQIDDALVQRLQSAQPEMTITSNGSGREEQYLGKPVAQLAAVRLLELGCTMEGHEPGRGSQTFSRENLPSKEIPFSLSRVSLPPKLKLTSEIVDDLAALPSYYHLNATGVHNADLLTGIPGLRRASGVGLENSDLTDAAFRKLVEQDPDGYFDIKDTQVTKSLTQQLDEDAPYLAFHSRHGTGRRWLEIVYEKLKSAKQNRVKPTKKETSPRLDDAQLAFERETAEWALRLGARVVVKTTNKDDIWVSQIDQLPKEPFRILQIPFDQSREIIQLPSLSRLSRLLSLHSLSISNCGLRPGALKGLEFGNGMTHFRMSHSLAKATHLSNEIKGLENLDTFEISTAQVNDHFQFLDLMPRLRDLRLWNPNTQQLQDLADSSGFKQGNLRFLNLYANGRTFDSDAIRALQAEKPGMSIIVNDKKGHQRYLGTPVAREAAIKLLELGITIVASGPNQSEILFNKSNSPSESELFKPLEIILPNNLEITPEIAEMFSRLPPFPRLDSKGLKNADLLTAVPVMALCSGVRLPDSDLTDKGFESFYQSNPEVYINLIGTPVTDEKAKQVDQDYPFAAFHSSSHHGISWLKLRAKTDPQPPRTSPPERNDSAILASERAIAEWVINLGGKVSFKKANGTEKSKNQLNQLPDEPFRVIEIVFSRADQKITITSLSRLSSLLTLHSLNIMNCHLEPGALEGLQFNENTTDFHIYNTPLKTSELTSNMGLEHLDTFNVGAIQIDDQFRFLELMPRLRNLHLYNPIPQTLEDLARSPGFSKLKLRFLNINSFGRKYDPELIAELQKIQPGMTVIDNDLNGHNRYLGTPVARQAAIKLLDLGVTINATNGKTYQKSEYPPDSELFFPVRVILPPALEITPETVEALSQLPPFFGLEASGVRNADLLAKVPVLKLCGGIQISDTDLSEQGFEALIQIHPDGYVNAMRTKITREKARQINRDYPYAAFNTDYHSGKRWLNDLKSQSPPPQKQQTPTSPTGNEKSSDG